MSWDGLSKRVAEAKQRASGPTKEVTTAFGRKELRELAPVVLRSQESKKSLRESGPVPQAELVTRLVESGLQAGAAKAYAARLARGDFISFEDAVSDYSTNTPAAKGAVRPTKVREAAVALEGRPILREDGAK